MKILIYAIAALTIAVLAPLVRASAPVVGIKAKIYYPGCVIAGHHATFRLNVRNTATMAETVIVRITSRSNADLDSLIIARGTDRLLRGRGYWYWKFRLKPGQSVTKRLVALIQPSGNLGVTPPRWGFTELISASNIAKIKLPPFQISVPYCPA